MNRINPLFLVLLALILAGCAATSGIPEAETVGARKYATVPVPGGSVRIVTAQAYGDENGLLVSGRVRRMHKLPLPGHLDLVVCAPNGTPLAREKIRILGLASNRKGTLELPFRINLALAPPEGARVLLRYHPPAGPAGNFGCPLS